jgi:transcriptional regulator with XRE-family HTH domain
MDDFSLTVALQIVKVLSYTSLQTDTCEQEVGMDESAATQAFGTFIRTLRERRGFKQAELAELSGVSTPYISQVELGKRIPTIKVCLQLAEALNYDPRDLLLQAMALKTPAIAEVIYRGDTDSKGAHRLLAEEQLQNIRASVASLDSAPPREPSQGKSPQRVFTDLYPLIHAAETPVSGSYARAAQVSATLAEAYAGIAGKTVLDLGCGYGNTTLMLAAYGPQEIVAVDNSPHMIDMLKRVLLSKVSIRLWLRSIQAPDLLGELYAPTLAHLI